jgi:hypothetical protein
MQAYKSSTDNSEYVYRQLIGISSRRLVIRSINVACRHHKLIHDLLGFHRDSGGGSLYAVVR